MSVVPEDFEPVIPYEATFDAGYGLEYVMLDSGAGLVRGRFTVTEGALDRHGAVHGGVLAGAAESLASAGTAAAVLPQGNVAMGLSNDTTVMARVTVGTIELEARLVSSAEHGWVWTVDARDGEGRPCSHSRVTVAVRPMPKERP
jgi:uncharacterized protein (TIGR00369 family)